MENVLEVYHRPHHPDRPLVCLDETSKQLVAETRQPLPMQPASRRAKTASTSATAWPTCSCCLRRSKDLQAVGDGSMLKLPSDPMGELRPAVEAEVSVCRLALAVDDAGCHPWPATGFIVGAAIDLRPEPP
jgi:hypothetical protein